MDLIIVGAGRVGCSLAELALKEGHNVTLIESDEKKAQEATQKLDATVLHGNIAVVPADCFGKIRYCIDIQLVLGVPRTRHPVLHGLHRTVCLAADT